MVKSLSRHNRDGTHDAMNFMQSCPAQGTHTHGLIISVLRLAMLRYAMLCLARPLPCTKNRELSWLLSLNSPGTAQLFSREAIFIILTC